VVNPLYTVCISPFIFNNIALIYCANAPMIRKFGIWKRNGINWSGGYMIYIGMDIVKKKRRILINNKYGFQ